ncbi:MAG TPA: class F sortase [Euzebyales bacterium]|nr:class F sortase [Euzebyales bacterium]
MTRRRGAATVAALTTIALLAGGCGSGAQDAASPVASASSAPATESERTMREIIAAQASPPPVGEDEQPLAPDGSGPVGHRSARIEDVEREGALRPTRVRIPVLGIDAPVAALGVAASGEMDVPTDAQSVAWYEYGPSPGQEGSAVLAAHVDYNGVRGVFFDLAQLDRGDRVTVELDRGRARTFTVEERASVEKEALPIDELFRREGPPVLTLITCGGEFDAAARSYRSNVVVRAVPTG